MRRRSLSRFAAAASLWGAAVLGGCGGQTGGNVPPAGTLTVDVRPTVSAVAGLQLSSGRVQIEGLTVLGDVAPDGRSMVSEFNLDVLSSGASFSLSMLPQGVYSRVRFSVDHANAAGTWRGMPLTVSLEPNDDNGASVVDLRSDGVEVTPGHDGELAVGVDAGAWFARQRSRRGGAGSGARSWSTVRTTPPWRRRSSRACWARSPCKTRPPPFNSRLRRARRPHGTCTCMVLLWQLLQAPLPATVLTIGTVAGQSEALTLMG